jgi:Hg(II)-responsive transcriptional regulator
MRSGQVARQAGVNVETLRYYERRGLLPSPPREGSGYRAYGSDAVRIVRFVKRAQELGFSLDDVEALLELAGGGPDGCEAVQRLTGERIAELDRRIADLQAMRTSLLRLVATCHRPRRDRECPLIRSIETDAERGGDPT